VADVVEAALELRGEGVWPLVEPLCDLADPPPAAADPPAGMAEAELRDAMGAGKGLVGGVIGGGAQTEGRRGAGLAEGM
jgi:hypothetical protein